MVIKTPVSPLPDALLLARAVEMLPWTMVEILDALLDETKAEKLIE